MDQQRIMQPLMSPDIVIIHDNAGYHLLHGHLHLAMAIALSDTGKVAVDVRGYGTVQVAKTNGGLAVQTDGRQQALLVIDLALRPYRWKGFGPLKLIDSAEPTGPARKILQKLISCQ